MTDDETTIKRAVQYLHKRGLANYGELAELAGNRSRQLMRYWAPGGEAPRKKYLAEQWEKALKRYKD